MPRSFLYSTSTLHLSRTAGNPTDQVTRVIEPTVGESVQSFNCTSVNSSLDADEANDLSTVWTHNVTDVHPDMACCLNLAWSCLKECIGASVLDHNYTVEVAAILDTEYDYDASSSGALAVDKEVTLVAEEEEAVIRRDQANCRGTFFGYVDAVMSL